MPYLFNLDAHCPGRQYKHNISTPTIEDRLTSSTANFVNKLKSLAKEWDYFPNVTLPTHHGMKMLLIIGPWSAKTENFSDELYALTCIDITTSLVELFG